MKMDEILYRIAEKVKNFAVIYLVDITKVPGKISRHTMVLRQRPLMIAV